MRGGSFPLPDLGQNPPSGSVIYYYLKEKSKEKVILEFLDAEGNLIKKFSSKEDEKQAARGGRFSRDRGHQVTAEKGMNRFIWNMRYPDAERVPGAVLWGGTLSGPVAVPGTYQVRLTVGDKSLTQSWQWKKDPRLETTQEEFQEQFDFLIRIRDKITEVNQSINRLRSIREQIDSLAEKVKELEGAEEITAEGNNIKKKLKEIEDALIQSKSKSNQDPLNYPIKLDNKIAALASVVARSDTRPTDQSCDVFEELSAKADSQLAKLKGFTQTELAAFNKMVREADIPVIIVK
jgi:hypothetical protein